MIGGAVSLGCYVFKRMTKKNSQTQVENELDQNPQEGNACLRGMMKLKKLLCNDLSGSSLLVPEEEEEEENPYTSL